MSPTSTESSTWDEALASLRQVIALSEGLALVLVVGPGTHAKEGLEHLRQTLPQDLSAAWHRLDRQGADLTATLSDKKPSLLLVHGLERLSANARQDVSVSLNLLRDTLSAFPTVIVLWIPREDLDEFRRLSPDLFHWRALLLILTESDLDDETAVPMATLAARRRFLSRVEQYVMQQLSTPKIAPEFEPPLIEPRVFVVNESEEMSFSRWASNVDHGFLIGPAGSGKSFALMSYTRNLARRAADDVNLPIPIFLAWRHLESRLHRPDLESLIPGEMATGLNREDAAALASGKLQLLLDGLDEVSEDLRPRCLEWLQDLRARHSDLRFIVTSRRAFRSLARLQAAHLLPWSPEDIHAFLQGFHGAEKGFTRQLGEKLVTSSYWEDLSRLPLTLRLLAELLAHDSAIPNKRFLILQELVEVRLVSWDRERGLGRFRATASPSETQRKLAKLALQMLRRGLPEIDAQTLDETGLEPDELSNLIHRAQLLTETADGQYSFSHRSLQEFFAARGLIDSRDAEAEIEAHLDEPAWRYVIVMAVGELVEYRGIHWFWEHFWPDSAGSLAEEQIAERMVLALEVAKEARINKGLRQHVLDAQRFMELGRTLPPPTRLALQEALASHDKTTRFD